MSIEIDGVDKRIGLALSGGGFRAAAFHLGTFRKLHDLKILNKIDVFSCVSGGSIAGAFLCSRWGNAEEIDGALDELETYLRTRSIAVSSFIGGALNPFGTRLDALASSYDTHLFDGGTLASLKNGPRIYINSTNLSTGNMFFYVAGGEGLEEMGEHELGQTSASDQKISTAVAASSAFPPVFPPLYVSEADYPNNETEYVTLTDGGVYDNLGVNPLMRVERNRIDYALISDGGKPFEISHAPTESGSKVLLEAIGILMEQVRGLQFQRMELAHAAGRGPLPMWFSIDSHDGQINSGDAAFASSIGTNLKRLTDAEMDVLTRHAGALCEARINKWAPKLLA
ncbi:patatin-like phospholipase family protein [Sulfitobacter geojensis]|uniref:patatin-like phospholipase family protein n=1 Tax=Sulfitobacter geojensis TaxID=1342299 RepID=UPI0036D8CAEE